MSGAIFQTTGQALHVSYMILSQEARQNGALRKAILQIMSQLDTLTARQRDWMNQLIGEPSGTVNFGGLSADEVRAQCAMVTQAVKDHLPAPEMWAIHARFIPTEFEDMGRDEEGRVIKRFFYSQERVDAIVGLSAYLQPLFPAIHGVALDMMIARAFANHAKIEISFRELAENFGGSHMTYARANKSLVEKLRELELMAVRRLTPMFERTGLVEKFAQTA